MKKVGESLLFEGEWLALFRGTFVNRQGATVIWESVRRRTSGVGVVVVARCQPSGRFILIRQFRPAINGYILSFPAGLADDDPEQALVELKEETGFSGRIQAVSPVLQSSSGVLMDRGRIVCVDVDESAPENQNPTQVLEESEDIEVLLACKEEVPDLIKREMERGTAVSANLWYFFMLEAMLRGTLSDFLRDI